MPERTSPSKKIRVVIVEDGAILRAGLKLLLDDQADIETVAESATLAEARAALRGLPADIVIVNLDADFERAAAELETFSRDHPALKIVVLTADENPDRISRLVGGGARGVVTKRAPAGSVVEATRRVSRGLRWTSLPPSTESESAREHASGWESLTPREREIAAAAAKGDRYGEIAESLGISPHTVRNHLRHVFEKLGVNSRVELAVYSAKVESR